jgi:hypothetical protein
VDIFVEWFYLFWYKITNPTVKCKNNHIFRFRKLKSVMCGYDYYELRCPVCLTDKFDLVR